MFDVVEASIGDLRAALESGATTAVEVVEAYLARIDRYDGADTPTALNSIVVRSTDALDLDAVVFPAVADVGPGDMDRNPVSADLGWRNGVWIANGDLAIRHLGIPTVTIPMGVMSDIGMPVGLTFAGRTHSDNLLLRLGSAFEAPCNRRTPPPRTRRAPTEVPRAARSRTIRAVVSTHVRAPVTSDLLCAAMHRSVCHALGGASCAMS